MLSNQLCVKGETVRNFQVRTSGSVDCPAMPTVCVPDALTPAAAACVMKSPQVSAYN